KRESKSPKSSRVPSPAKSSSSSSSSSLSSSKSSVLVKKSLSKPKVRFELNDEKEMIRYAIAYTNVIQSLESIRTTINMLVMLLDVNDPSSYTEGFNSARKKIQALGSDVKIVCELK